MDHIDARLFRCLDRVETVAGQMRRQLKRFRGLEQAKTAGHMPTLLTQLTELETCCRVLRRTLEPNYNAPEDECHEQLCRKLNPLGQEW